MDRFIFDIQHHICLISDQLNISKPVFGVIQYRVAGSSNMYLNHEYGSLTHWLLELFAKSAFFGYFSGSYLGWISAKLPLIQSKMHLQHNSLPFLPPESRFSALWLGHAQKSKFWDLRLFGILFSPFLFLLFSYSLTFAAVIDLLLGLLAVKKLLRNRHRDGQFLAWSSQVYWQEILLWVFHSTFWAFFVHIWGSIGPITMIWASLERSFPSAEVEYRWCQYYFGQKWWSQKRKKGQGSSQAVTGGTGVNGFSAPNPQIFFPLRLLPTFRGQKNRFFFYLTKFKFSFYLVFEKEKH